MNDSLFHYQRKKQEECIKKNGAKLNFQNAFPVCFPFYWMNERKIEGNLLKNVEKIKRRWKKNRKDTQRKEERKKRKRRGKRLKSYLKSYEK